ncbi:MAG: zinc-binding dehydrogenase [Planctomycetota bacterium]|jgi:L-iditol 2-dehydrogenase|nr:zinc-binding dehydrogenase [Planctomycetota bacterium]
MKVAAMFGDQKGGLVDKPDPEAKGDFVVVKVLSVPMCTEYKSFKAGGNGDCFGHEAAGEIAEVCQSSRVKAGDRVVMQPVTSCGKCHLCLRGENIHCQQMRNMLKETGNEAGQATYAQYLVKPDYHMSPIPDDISTDHAGMACCGLGPTFGAFEQMSVNGLDTVMITGMGPVGLGGVINATYRGARTIAVESHPFRANLAKELGAALVINPEDEDNLVKVMDFTDGIGVDKAVDCSGAKPAQRLLIDAARRKGQVTFVGEGGAVEVFISNDMVRKGLVLRGNWHYNLAEYSRLLNVIRNNTDKLDKFITHRFAMSDVQSAWELQVTGNCGKVVLDPWK